MLTDTRVEEILARIPALTVGVIGDLFLDRYLDIDAALTEPSIETGLDACPQQLNAAQMCLRRYAGAGGGVCGLPAKEVGGRWCCDRSTANGRANG